MSLDKAMQNMKFDKRLIDINYRNGQLTKEEYEAYLKALPDLGHNVDLVAIDAQESEDGSQDLQH